MHIPDTALQIIYIHKCIDNVFIKLSLNTGKASTLCMASTTSNGDEDDPEFSSPGSVKQLPRRTPTGIVEDMLTQISKVAGYRQILYAEFGCLATTLSAPAKGGGSPLRADGGEENNDFQFEVEMLVIDDDHEEKAPTIPPADLSACVVPSLHPMFRIVTLPWRQSRRSQSTTTLHLRS